MKFKTPRSEKYVVCLFLDNAESVDQGFIAKSIAMIQNNFKDEVCVLACLSNLDTVKCIFGDTNMIITQEKLAYAMGYNPCQRGRIQARLNQFGIKYQLGSNNRIRTTLDDLSGKAMNVSPKILPIKLRFDEQACGKTSQNLTRRLDTPPSVRLEK